MTDPTTAPQGTSPGERPSTRAGTLRRLLARDAAPGIALAVATVAALSWVNLGSAGSYDGFWQSHLNLGWAGRLGGIDVRDVVNDAGMAVFFFVMGMEIKSEWIGGSLRDRRFARLPIIAALGGMVVPALFYVAIAHSTPAAHGWGIPMATDIAFVVGVMALLGRRIPPRIRVFLLTLAVVDDLGAIVVIATAYAGTIESGWLALAVAGLAVVVVVRVLGVQRIAVFAVLAAFVWYATWQSGVHATIAGVALAFATPTTAGDAGAAWSPLRTLRRRLEPFSNFVVLPIFALANAGVALGGGFHGEGGRVALGVAVGLVVGKLVGVTGASWCAVKARVAAFPEGLRWRHLVGAGCLAGIGFTMSLFITELAFTTGPAAELTADAKRAILGASVVAGCLGSAVFVVLGRSQH